jgi:hypothetical protein
VSKSNQIELISLDEDGKGFTKIAKVTHLAEKLARYNSFDDHIVALYPISVAESRSLQCVAITSAGD